MPVKVVELVHTGIRVRPKDEDIEAAREIYSDLLGLQIDERRPQIPEIPGFWVNVKEGARQRQLHIFGADRISPAARSVREDPTRPHVAFAVEDLEEAKRELERRNIDYWVYEGLVGRASEQVFFEDPSGNMIELQQHTD